MSALRRITARRLAHLFLVALAFIVVWIVAGLFAASEFHRRSIAMGGELEKFFEILMYQMVTSLNWAFFTPFLIVLAERLPFRRPVFLRNVLILSALLPGIALIRSIWGAVVMNLGEHHHVSTDFVRLSVSIRLHRYIAISA